MVDEPNVKPCITICYVNTLKYWCQNIIVLLCHLLELLLSDFLKTALKKHTNCYALGFRSVCNQRFTLTRDKGHSNRRIRYHHSELFSYGSNTLQYLALRNLSDSSLILQKCSPQVTALHSQQSSLNCQ